jgi:peptide-methionine (S)-S-oxide reductase
LADGPPGVEERRMHAKRAGWIGALAGLSLLGAAREGGTVKKTELATFGAGCFWCTEAVFEGVPGVIAVTSGYSGGTTQNPTYKEVCSGRSGHAEVVRIEFDPEKVAYTNLLDLFWRMHDPTTPDRQGADVGTQYRSVVFFHSEEQKRQAEETRQRLAKSGAFKDPIVTQIAPAGPFYAAEDYHQDYFRNNREAPYCRMVIMPKLKKLTKP